MRCFASLHHVSSPALRGAPDLVEDVPEDDRSVQNPHVRVGLPPRAVDKEPGTYGLAFSRNTKPRVEIFVCSS